MHLVLSHHYEDGVFHMTGFWFRYVKYIAGVKGYFLCSTLMLQLLRRSILSMWITNLHCTFIGRVKYKTKIKTKYCTGCCKSHTAILVTIFWEFLMFYQIFFSLQVKRSVIFSNRHGLYESLQETRKWGNIRRISKFHRVIA